MPGWHSTTNVPVNLAMDLRDHGIHRVVSLELGSGIAFSNPRFGVGAGSNACARGPGRAGATGSNCDPFGWT